MKFKKVATGVLALGLAASLAACSGGRGGGSTSASAGSNKGALVGVAMPTKVSERWIKDELRGWVDTLRPLAEELGCATELADVLRLIERGGDYELQRQAARDAGAALEPGTRTRGDAGAEQGFTQPEAWVAAVDLTVRTLRESL